MAVRAFAAFTGVGWRVALGPMYDARWLEFILAVYAASWGGGGTCANVFVRPAVDVG